MSQPRLLQSPQQPMESSSPASPSSTLPASKKNNKSNSLGIERTQSHLSALRTETPSPAATTTPGTPSKKKSPTVAPLPLQPTMSKSSKRTALKQPNSRVPMTNNTNFGPSGEIVTPSMMTNNAAVVAALQGKCDFPKNKMLMEYTKEINARGHRLEKQPYYVGMLNQEDVAPYLKKTGDFGIHACDQEGGKIRLMLSVRGLTDILHHFDLIFDAKGRGWSLAPQSHQFHKTIIDLVEFHKINPLPQVVGNLCLKDSITRPSWLLKHENVTYIKEDLLGSGNFCEVFRGKMDGRKVIAIKVCKSQWRYNDRSISQNTKEKDAREALIKEGSLMSRIRHPNVITFYGICCDHPPIMIALEFCPGDSLSRHLTEQKEAISVGERIKYLCEAAAGMSFLEKNELVHRDLAARNCLISKYGRVKIADFGLSKLVSELAGQSWAKQQVPVRWMAPETLRKSPQYSTKSDVWSFGILTYEVFNYGEKPWPDSDAKTIAKSIRSGQMMKLPDYTPTQVKTLVSKMWSLKPAERPDFPEICIRMKEIQKMFPAPQLQNCTIIKIKGVLVPPETEDGILEDNSEDVDIQVLAAATDLRSVDEEQQRAKKTTTTKESTTVENPEKKKKKRRTGCCCLDYFLNLGYKSDDEK